MPELGSPQAPGQTLESETHITKVGTSVATAIGALGAALIVFADDLNKLDDVATVGFFGLLAVALVAVALMVISDVRARANIKVAEISAGPALASASTTGGGSLSQCSSTSAPMAVKIAGDSARFGVLALRHDGEGRTWYLVGRQGQRPKWVQHDDIEDTFYANDPSAFHPPLSSPQQPSEATSS